MECDESPKQVGTLALSPRRRKLSEKQRMGLLSRLISVFRQERLDRDLEEEMQFHLEMRARDNAAGGMAADEARRDAIRRFGNTMLHKERARDVDVILWLDDAWRNVKYACRVLLRSPAFTLTAFVSIAIGVGANSAIFSCVNALLIRKVPVRNPDQLVRLEWEEHLPDGRQWTSMFSYPVYRDLRDAGAAYADIYGASPEAGYLTFGGETERVECRLVTGNYFSSLGVVMPIGRAISPEDESMAGGVPVAVLNYDYWKLRFGGDLSVIGARFRLGAERTAVGAEYVVVGVAPRGLDGANIGTLPDLFIPISRRPQFRDRDDLALRAVGFVQPGGRLRPGVSIAAAQAALTAVFQGIDRGEPGHGGRYAIAVLPASRGLYSRSEDYLKPLQTLQGMVAAVLLIVCANLAGLAIARGAAREREVSIRLAIGAGRLRVACQLLTETMLVAAAGGLAGIPLGYAFDCTLLAMLRGYKRTFQIDVRPDINVFLFTLALSALTGLAVGLLPALRAAKAGMNPALKTGTSGSFTRPRLVARRVLIIAQVALSLTLLAAAGLFGRTLANLRSWDRGFDHHNMVSALIDPTIAGYKGERAYQFYDSLVERVRRLPFVESAAVTSINALNSWVWTVRVALDGRPGTQQADVIVVSPDYLQLTRMRLLSGRYFEAADNRPHASKTAIVSRNFAERYFAGSNPVGRRIGMDDRADAKIVADTEIIGVVDSVKYRDPSSASLRLTCYVPFRSWPVRDMQLFARATGDPRALIPSLRRELRALDSNVPLSSIATMDEQYDQGIVVERLLARTSSIFGSVTLGLALVGLYGVLAFLVASRTPEIGIRIALGAGPGKVTWLVLKESLWLTAAGIALGAWGAKAVGRLIQGFLFGVSASDDGMLAGAAALLLATGLAASLIPACRAARIDPNSALRCE